MECPVCRLVNPDGAQRCDCGYDFVAKVVKESYLDADVRQRIGDPDTFVQELGKRDVRMGALVLVCGIVATGGTYAFAPQSGHFFIMYGAILLGLLWLFRGLDRIRTGVDRRFWGGPPS